MKNKQNINRRTDIQNKVMVTKGDCVVGKMSLELAINMYTWLCTKIGK